MGEPGVGIVYVAGLDALLDPASELISVVELEPQTLWTMTSDGAGRHYRCNEDLLERIAALPMVKLPHGVGQPLGGTVDDPVEHMPLLRDAVERLDPPWISEHLSFNRAMREGTVEHAGFLLPPPQSPAAVRVAAHNLRRYRRALGRPVAFETGVNYLRRREGDMSDGDFFAAVAQTADSGILLDLHNLWCNERNGRQSVADALASIPLERVWELHLAGGMEVSGYWLDAHSGAVPPEVMEIAAGLIPHLPNLGAVIFELLPQHLPGFGIDNVQRQLEALQRLWDMRAPRVICAGATVAPLDHGPARADFAEVAAWEAGLVETLRSPAARMRADPGCELLTGLIEDFRRGSLARALRYTMTALLLGLGPDATHALLAAYFEEQSPEPFGAIEADCFARFLRSRIARLPRIQYLEEVLAFEHALVRATVFGMESELAWTADPVKLFESLDAGDLPVRLPVVTGKMHIRAS